jgi:hypothetical protein
MQVEDIADRDAEWFVVVVHACPPEQCDYPTSLISTPHTRK